MQPRLNIIEMFSTFAYFHNDSGAQWVTDSKLRRSIKNRLLESSSPESEQFWSLFWYKIWREGADGLGLKHLSAYLQEPCYWAAKNTMTKFSSIQYRLADYFQMGIAEVEKVCKGFKPERSSNLKAYAKIAFPSLFTDILRQRQDVDICTNYSLLRKVSKIVFVEALESAGLAPDQIARYKLARKCFQELYTQTQVGGIGKLPDPSKQLWSEIADFYNRERHQLVSPGKQLDSDTVEQWLNQAAVWIRSYLYPKIDSLDLPVPESDLPETSDLLNLASKSPMSVMIAIETIQERQNHTVKMHNIILSTLRNKLDPEMREILHMYYRQKLNQQEIAVTLDRKQVWVSRRLSKARTILIKELTLGEQESKKSKEVNSDNSNELEDRSVALEEWLEVSDWS